MSNATHNQTDSGLAELLNQIVSATKKNQHLLAEILAEIIQDKESAGTSHPEITALLSQIVGAMEKNQQGFVEKKALTAAEISALWLQYMGDSMSVCVYKYFLNIVEDAQIKPILELALQLAESHITQIRQFLKSANFQIPIGFTDSDVNLSAPRLFSDSFLLFYSNIMTIHGLTAYSLAVTSSEREDIQNYFFDCIATTKDLFQKITSLAKTQTEYTGVPSIPSPHGVAFVDSMGIIENLFGSKRPLNISELTNLFFNSKKTGFVSSLSLAFSQVAEREEVRKFMLKNVKLAGKDTDSFNELLMQDNLPVPARWDAEITDSTISPFSDKLMMFHAAFLVNAALSYYAAAVGSSLRSDMIANYKNVMNHAMQAGIDCYHIMVKHGWLEKQPEAIDRNALAQGSDR
ncbi:DUF3231 family protein [Paenibacillus oryzisoli]|uniref:DUF3231 family protein n=1 Tax=Paenibacillus oryzisoli TaxID=1850517 RepID=UPI003D28F800